MIYRIMSKGRLSLLILTLLAAGAWSRPGANTAIARLDAHMQKRWLFIWRDMSDPKEVERMIARFPRAQADGYNGVVFSYNVAPVKAAELREAAKKYGLDLIAVVMNGSRDHNYKEGVLCKDALFVARNGAATLMQDNPTHLVNGDFENMTGNHFNGWTLQDDEGVTTFADHETVHGGKTSVRMDDIGKNQFRHCRLAQPIKLQPYREYRISFWVKSENLSPADPNVEILTPDTTQGVSFQSFHTDKTQGWTHYDLVFNSLDHRDANLYLGSWNGKTGKLWWDDLSIEEIGLVNVLRRPGCPVTVRGENGMVYEEGRDYAKIVDPLLQPYHAYHEQPPIKLTANTRIHENERLRVSYYHSIIVYEDRLASCLSEPKIFEDWQEEIKQADELYHPAAFLMSHDEIRVMNQCALCQSKHMTPAELLDWNVNKAAQIIRTLRPDAGIWVWNDMFDPNHNAVEHYYAVNGSLVGSWKGLDKDIGIVNWNGGHAEESSRFFADLGHKQILSGYYDGDEEGAEIAKWVGVTKNMPGISGAMYTTWEDRYDAMDKWAKQAWAGAATK